MTDKSDLLKRIPAIPVSPEYKVINLDYLQELSMGDTVFQGELTKQFIEISIQEGTQLQSYFEAQDYSKMQPVAHSMLSTIYVMGLGPKLETHLQALKDYSVPKKLKMHIEIINEVCKQARAEARIFLESLS
ncbi:hypothetical protein [Pedobacter nototheniae]|uniref:hypothetical protein n=1 Tax=Pedobacter nototheniae TaxID=2488994 RepID=UPI00292EFE6F|nr:hypothetical protein [Pedobacter nototheniae]